MLQQERDSFVFISSSEEAKARVKQATEFLSIRPFFEKDLKTFLEDDKIRPRTLLLDLNSINTDTASLLPKIRQILPKTQIVGLIDQLSNRNPAWFIQHFVTNESLGSFALEFLLFQRVFCEFYEISPTDLFPGTLVYFNAYHFLPLNLKYLPLVHENFTLSERKHKRIDVLKSVYIFRGDSSAYVQYIERYFDQYKLGLKKRSKARTYQLLVEWRELLYSYLFESRQVESCALIRPDFILWLNELLNYLSSAQDPWSMLWELTHLDCFEFDFSLIELLVASFLCRNLGDDEIEKIVDLRLLLTLCRTKSPSLLYKKWHLNQELSSEEKQTWNQYPENLKGFTLFQDYSPEVLENLKHYRTHFLDKSDTNVTNGRLVYTYLGEVIATVLRRSSSQNYQKSDIVDSVIVQVKADGVLTEAWIEEVRQFLKIEKET